MSIFSELRLLRLRVGLDRVGMLLLALSLNTHSNLAVTTLVLALRITENGLNDTTCN